VAQRVWQVQEAKNKLSEVIAEAQRRGPQAITRHGRRVAVLLSSADFERLAGRPKTSLLEFLSSPIFGEIELEDRDATDFGREVEI
jgi:antitoxin Phd